LRSTSSRFSRRSLYVPTVCSRPFGIRAVELEHPLGDVLEKVAVVADHDERLGLALEHCFEPEDAFDVEVVRRLVEQEDVGLAHELLRDREPLAPAAGERLAAQLGLVETGLAEGDGNAAELLVLVERVVVVQRVEQHFLDSLAGREHRILRHVPDAYTLAQSARAGVRLLDAGENLQQRRLARSIRPHQPDVIALGHSERQSFEERTRRERLGERLSGEEDGHFGRKITDARLECCSRSYSFCMFVRRGNIRKL
jgi:hypothetical protein